MEEGRAIAYGKCIQRVNACMDDGRGTLRYYIHSALPARSRGRVHIRREGRAEFLLSIEFLLTKQLSNSIATIAHFVGAESLGKTCSDDQFSR